MEAVRGMVRIFSGIAQFEKCNLTKNAANLDLHFSYICKTGPPFAGKFRSVCMKNEKYNNFSLLSNPVPFKFIRQHLLLGVFTL